MCDALAVSPVPVFSSAVAFVVNQGTAPLVQRYLSVFSLISEITRLLQLDQAVQPQHDFFRNGNILNILLMRLFVPVNPEDPLR